MFPPGSRFSHLIIFLFTIGIAVEYAPTSISQELLQEKVAFALKFTQTQIALQKEEASINLLEVVESSSRVTQHAVTINTPENKTVRFYDPLEPDTPIVFEATIYHQHSEDRDVDLCTDLSLLLLLSTQPKEKHLIQFTVCDDAESHRAVTKFIPPPSLTSALNNINAASAEHVTVMSANIWNYNYWNLRQDVMRQALQEAGDQPNTEPSSNVITADVIGFQEVRARKAATAQESRFQVTDLANLLPGFSFVYVPAMAFQESENEFVHEGLALFSRYPILEYEAVRLTRDSTDPDDFHQRLCLHALIDTPVGKLHFLTTHLSLSKKARDRTIAELARYAQRLVQGPGGDGFPVLLVGDMNAERLTVPGMEDVWIKVHGQENAQSPDAFTFNSWGVKSRIDYMFMAQPSKARCHAGKQQAKLRVESIGLRATTGAAAKEKLKPVGGVADLRQTLFASDHRFLAAVLTQDGVHSACKDEL